MLERGALQAGDASHQRPFPAQWDGGASAADDAADVSVDLLVAVLRRRWRVVASVTLAVVAVTAVLVVREKSVYRATAVVRLADARRAMTTGIEAADEPQERLTSPVLSQIQLLRSRTVIGAVVDSVGSRLRPDFRGLRPQLLRHASVDPGAPTDTLRLRFHAHGVVAQSRAGAARARYGDTLALGGVRIVLADRPDAGEARWPVIGREQAIDLVLAGLRVKPRVQTNVVDVTYTARRAVMAQRVVNAVATEFQAANARSARQQSRLRRVFLEAQLRQTDSIFARAQVSLSDFRRAARLYSSREKLTGQQRDLARLEVRRQELEVERRTYRALLGRFDAAGPEERRAILATVVSLPELAGEPAVAGLQEQLVRQRAAHDSLTSGPWRRASTHPDVERLRELVAGTEARLVDAVRGRIRSLDAQIAGAAELAARNAAELQTLPELEAEEVRLTQRVETLRKLGDTLRDEYQRARMAEAVEVGQVEIVDLASLPYAPDDGMRVLKLVLGLVLGLLVGGGAAFLLHLRDGSIRLRDDLVRTLRVPNLALIPRVASAARAAAMPRPLDALLRAAGHRVARPAADDPARLVTDPTAAAASQEAFRVLRTNLLYSQIDAPLRTLVVTSAGPREGKSLTAANLAITFARGGARVLLVDGDLRRGRLRSLFNVPRGVGLAQLLRDTTLPAMAVHPTMVDGLYLLTAGSTQEADAADLLRGSRLRDLLRSLASQVDLVLVDAPPVLAVADASLLAAVADGVLLVVRAGRTHRVAARDALLQLSTVGARIVGTVLNDASDDAVPYAQSYVQYYATHATSANR